MCRPPLVALLDHAPAAVLLVPAGRRFLYRGLKSLQDGSEDIDDNDDADWFRGRATEMDITMIGLQNAGKTSLLRVLAVGSIRICIITAH